MCSAAHTFAKNTKKEGKSKVLCREPFFHLTKLCLLLYNVSHISTTDMKIFEQPIGQEEKRNGLGGKKKHCLVEIVHSRVTTSGFVVEYISK